MFRDIVNYVFNNLRNRKLRSWLTLIGIVIGIAAVVALIGLGEGLKDTINAQFGFLGADVITISASGGFGPPGTGVTDPLTQKDLDAVKNSFGVREATGRLLSPVSLNFNRQTSFGYVATIPEGENRETIESIFNIEIEEGRLLEDGDTDSVVLGHILAQENNPFGRKIRIRDTIKIQDKDFKVVGIMKRKGSFQVDGSILMNEDTLRDTIGREDEEYDIVVARFDESIGVERVKENIERALRRSRNVKEGEENFGVETPQSILNTVNSFLIGIQIFVYLIAGLSLLIGGIGIMNTMYTSVLERTKEVGIMKSIGAKNKDIFILFFFESGLIGAVGGIIGATIGFLTAEGLSFLGRIILGTNLISSKISFGLFFGAILFSFILGSFFGTLPAIKASKLNPVDSLRAVK